MLDVSAQDGSNVLSLTPGTNYKFILQIPVIGNVSSSLANVSGMVNGWQYTFTYRSIQSQTVISAPGSAPSQFYYLFVNASFESTSNAVPIVLNGSLNPKAIPGIDNLVNIVNLLPGLPYNTNMYNMYFIEEKTFVESAVSFIQGIPLAISNWFAHLRQTVDDSGRRIEEWLASRWDPVNKVLDAIWSILAAIWKVIYDIGAFIVMAWPLWLAIGILILIVEVKKWKRTYKENKEVKESARKAEQMTKIKLEQEKKLEEARLESLKRKHQAEEEHARKLKEIQETPSQPKAKILLP